MKFSKRNYVIYLFLNVNNVNHVIFKKCNLYSGSELVSEHSCILVSSIIG